MAATCAPNHKPISTEHANKSLLRCRISSSLNEDEVDEEVDAVGVTVGNDAEDESEAGAENDDDFESDGKDAAEREEEPLRAVRLSSPMGGEEEKIGLAPTGRRGGEDDEVAAADEAARGSSNRPLALLLSALRRDGSIKQTTNP